MKSLDELNSDVTEAIILAERIPDQESPEAKQAHLRVSDIEFKISKVTEPNSVEGMIARRGSVTAAISARDFPRARLFISAFLRESGTPDSLRDNLTELGKEIEELEK